MSERKVKITDAKLSQVDNKAVEIIDIYQTMSQDVMNKFENIGLDFLEELGYKIPKRPISAYRARKLGEQLKAANRCLVYKGVEDFKEGKFLYWWELHEMNPDGSTGKFICRSQGLKTVFIKPENK